MPAFEKIAVSHLYRLLFHMSPKFASSSTTQLNSTQLNSTYIIIIPFSFIAKTKVHLVLDDVQFCCLFDGLDYIIHLEFIKYVSAVIINRVETDKEGFCYLLV